MNGLNKLKFRCCYTGCPSIVPYNMLENHMSHCDKRPQQKKSGGGEELKALHEKIKDARSQLEQKENMMQTLRNQMRDMKE